jgi:hypothetical protein
MSRMFFLDGRPHARQEVSGSDIMDLMDLDLDWGSLLALKRGQEGISNHGP